VPAPIKQVRYRGREDRGALLEVDGVVHIVRDDELDAPERLAQSLGVAPGWGAEIVGLLRRQSARDHERSRAL
jgi:hypothetical protein